MTRTPVTLGHHWIVDLHGCPIELLDDHDLMCQRLKETTERFGLTLLDIVSNRFEPQGVTVVGLLAESQAKESTVLRLRRGVLTGDGVSGMTSESIALDDE